MPAQIGINDKELLQYTLEQALSIAPSRDNFTLPINSEIFDMAQVEEKVSAVDDSPILLVYSIYIRLKCPPLWNRGTLPLVSMP